MIKFKAFLAILSVFFPINQAFKVVIFVPTLSNSQLVLNYRIGDLLASAGHDVTMYRPQLNPDGLKGSSKLAKEIRVTAYRDAETYRSFIENMGATAFGNEKLRFSFALGFMDMMTDSCDMQISNNKLMAQLRGENFDIAIVHMYDFCPLGMVHALKIPTHIWMSSGKLLDYMAWYSGAPTPVSYVPNTQRNHVKMTSSNAAVGKFFSGKLLMSGFYCEYYGADFPSVETLARKSPLIFVNSIELIDFPRPILHKIVYIGGIGMNEPKKLDNKWEQLMNNSIEGAVLLSMGSVVNSSKMPQEFKLSFLKAFANFPSYTFIWKYEDPDFPEAKNYKHVHLSPWVPQTDLFNHPKMRAFITHGGYNSFQEAAYSGIPMISIPLFGDQYGNTRRAERHGIGIGLDKLTFSEQTLTEALKKVLNQPSYQKNAKKVGSMLKKKPIKSEDLAVRWVEFLAEYKELPNLEPAGNDLNLLQYFSIDVAVGVISVLFFLIYLCWRALFYCYSVICILRTNKRKRE